MGSRCIIVSVLCSVQGQCEITRVGTYRKAFTIPKIMAALPNHMWIGANLVVCWVFLNTRWCMKPKVNWARMNMNTMMPMTWWAVLKFLVCRAVQSVKPQSFTRDFPQYKAYPVVKRAGLDSQSQAYNHTNHGNTLVQAMPPYPPT